MFSFFKKWQKNRMLDKNLEQMIVESWYYEVLTEHCSGMCLDTHEEREKVARILTEKIEEGR